MERVAYEQEPPEKLIVDHRRQKPPGFNQLLKAVQHQFKEEVPELFPSLQSFYGDKKPDAESIRKLASLIESVVKERHRYKREVDAFMYVLRSLYTLSKGHAEIFREKEYYEHLEILKTLQRRRDVYDWGSDVKVSLN
jgi:hypothetical protein